MKLLFVDTYYPSFLNFFYNQRSQGNLFKTLFGTSNFYSNALNQLGHSAKTVVLNDQHSQLSWANQHHLKVGSPLDRVVKQIPYIRGQIKPRWTTDVLKKQIAFYKPDVLYFLDITYLSPDVLKQLKPKVNLLVGQIASPLPADHYLKSFDLITSSLPNIVSYAKKLSVNAEYLKLAFEPSILKQLKKIRQPYQAIHIGGYGPIHQERNRILEIAARKTHIDFWGYQESFLQSDSPILKHFHGQSWGRHMYELLYNSKITMTKHIHSVAGPYANNMTLFEATGCGTLLITDRKKNLEELFIPEKEVVTYSSGTELAEKIDFYLKHDRLRSKIAYAGQRRTLKEHNYQARMQEFLKILKNYL